MRHIPKIVFIVFCLCFFLETFAYYRDYPYDGFYVGIGAGGVKTSGKINLATSINHNQIPLDGDLLGLTHINLNYSDEANKTSAAGAIYLGYGKTFSWKNIGPDQRHFALYLGGEFFGNVADRSVTAQNNFNVSNPNIFKSDFFVTSTSIGTLKSRAQLNRWEFGLDFRPGVLLTPTFLIYGRVGVAFNRLKFSQQNVEHYSITLGEDGSDDAITLTMQSNLNIQQSKNIAALRVGGGLEDMFYKNWSLRIDYIYTDYKKLSVSQAAPTSALIFEGTVLVPAFSNGFTTNTKIKVSSNAVLASVNYYF